MDVRRQDEPTIRRQLNLRWLIATTIVVAAVVVAAHLWHRRQVVHLATAFIDQADRLEGEGDWGHAAQQLFHYLQIHPEDCGARIRLARTFDRSATNRSEKTRAADLYYQAIETAPEEDRKELRFRLLKVLIETGAFLEAEAEVRKLDANGSDPQAAQLLALALYGQHRSGAFAVTRRSLSVVGDALETALELNPGDVELSRVLAVSVRREPQLLPDRIASLPPEKRESWGDELMDRMVEANPGSADAHLVRYLYRVEAGMGRRSAEDHQAALEEDLAEALKCGANRADVLLAAAKHSLEAGKFYGQRGPDEKSFRYLDEALKYYERVIEVVPGVAAGYLGAGEVYMTRGRTQDAITVWNRGLNACTKGDLVVALRLRSAEVLIAQGHLEEAEKSLHVVERIIGKTAATVNSPTRISWERSSNVLWAKWYIRNNEYSRAASLLKQVVAGQRSLASDLAVTMEAWKLIASIYARIGLWDQAGAAYEQLVMLEPKAVWPRMAAAEAWERAGQIDRAIRGYQGAVAVEDDAEGKIALARALLQQQLLLPANARDWRAFDAALADLRSPKTATRLREPWRVGLLEASGMVARSANQEKREPLLHTAAELCRSAERQFPDSRGLLEALPLAYEQAGCPKDADRVIEKLERQSDAAAVAWLMRARVQLHRKNYDQARETLTAALQRLPPGSHPIVEYELIQVALQEGKLKEAYTQMRALYAKQPANVVLIRQMAELALAAGDMKEVERWEQELLPLDRALAHCYRAARLVNQAKGPDDVKLAESLEVLDKLETERPAWAPVYVVRGMVFSCRGAWNPAADAYREAIRLGDRRVSVYQRLIESLCRSQQFSEAEKYLSELETHGENADVLFSIANLRIAQDRTDEAVAILEKVVQRKPEHVTALNNLATLLAEQASGRAEALEHIDRAIKVAGERPDLLDTKGTILMLAGRTADAVPLLEKAAAASKPDPRYSLHLAVAYGRLGEIEKARNEFRKVSRDDLVRQVLTASDRRSLADLERKLVKGD